jgi:shikimate kinase / 3-dehydroquinate synthase
MIYLTGFMGSGKTTVGEVLASLMKRPFIDLDKYMTAKVGKSITEIFACAGEPAFRALENESLLEVAEGIRATIVSTGGGLPVSPVNRMIMKASGHIVYLKADFDTLITRIPEDPGRPLWNKRAFDLLEERKPAYEEADLIIDTEHLSVNEVARMIFDRVKDLSDPLPVLVLSSAYPIHIGQGIFKNLHRFLGRHVKPEGVFVILDEHVDKLHHHLIQSALRGINHHILVLPAGEGSKSFPSLQQVLDGMFSVHMNRQWLCLAVGGGVTGDLAAFASSIFMRGIPVVQIPTTLLAQVDSSIGGKTGINISQGKNLVGTFNQPLFVLSDVNFLATLDPQQINDAMAEVIKYGVIMDRDLFKYLEDAESPDYEHIVAKCSGDKASVITKDERENGLRRILNFGHTLGHAIELTSNYSVSHGQAVGAGMIFASWLSEDLGLLKKKDMKRIISLVNRYVFVNNKPEFPEPGAIKTGIEMDKKSTREGIHFVLTQGIGDVSVKKLTSSQILDAYERFIRKN